MIGPTRTHINAYMHAYVHIHMMYVRILTHMYDVCITGFLSRMLATLYDLEVVEEASVRDWLSPPDKRHSFLKQA